MRVPTRLLVLLFFLLLLPTGRAADPLAYRVVLVPSGVAALDSALAESSTLISLRATAPVGAFGLIGRARNDRIRFHDALESFGYYKGSVSITIDGKALDAPNLATSLMALPAGAAVIVRARVDLGPLFHLGEVRIEGTVPEEARGAFALRPGAPARAAAVLAAGHRLLTALQDEGYALAKVAPPIAYLRPATDTLDIIVRADAGPRVDLGPIRLSGLDGVNESFVRRRLSVHPGERYSPGALASARQKLAQLPVFSSVGVQTASEVNAEGRLPVTFLFAERKQHVVSLNAAYSTDLGVSLGASWEDRNLFGNAEDLKLSASTNLGGTAVEGLGYQLSGTFTKPDFLLPDQTLAVHLGTVDQDLEAYDQLAVASSATLSRPLLPHLRLSAGIGAERERITQDAIARHFTVIGLPIGLAYDSTNSLLAPTRGVRASASLTPSASFGPPSAEFVIAEASASTYLDASGVLGEKPGWSVLAVRGLIGSILGAPLPDLPADKRFYAGGSASIRGYRFMSVGPQFPDEHPTGGEAVSAGTIEVRQRFLAHWGMAMFADAGDVSANADPFGGALRVGAGAGLRYYTPIGPIRADVAFPLIRQRGGDRFELYIGIGEAF